MESELIMPKQPAVAGRSRLLITLHVFLGVGALFGGIGLIASPTGELLRMPLSLLEHSPFPSFFIPGLILAALFGALPIAVSSALVRRWSWPLAERLNVFPELHWSWTFSLYTGFALVIWLCLQVYMLQGVHAIHLFYWALGIAIQVVTLLPRIQQLYRKAPQC